MQPFAGLRVSPARGASFLAGRSSMRIFKLAAAAALAAAVTGSAASADPNELVAHATQVAQHMSTDPAFTQAQNMLQNARAVLIVPALVKGGFIFGAEGGDGV